jgi:hypothetical protein
VSSLTAFLTPGRGYVRLELDYTTPAGNSLEAKVWRVVNGALTPIRDGWPASLSHAKAVIYDTEMPLDTPMTYRAFMPLNLDGGFESNVDGWDLAHNTENAASGGWASITRSTDYYVPGTGVASIKGVPVGGVASMIMVSEEVPIVAGVALTVSGNIMVNLPYSSGVGLVIRWYTAAHAFISATGTADDLWPVPGEWGSYTLSGTAPATTAFARVGLIVGGSPGATMNFFLDEIYASVAASTVDSAQTLFESSDNTGWWTDPLHPATMLKLQIDLRAAACASTGVAFLGTGDRSRPADSSVLEIPDAERGSSIYARRKAVRSSVSVVALSAADQDRMTALHASGAPVLLQLPARYLEAPVYGLYADTNDGRIASDMRLPYRVLTATYVDVGPPVGPADGVLGTRYQDLDSFSTFAAATAAARTWIDALQGELSTAT